jgi:aminoglycoside phosphotransferase (APT) family kinase protein
MSTAIPQRDPETTALLLREWLAVKLVGAGTVMTEDSQVVKIVDLAVPKAGFSNETILATAQWRTPLGEIHEREIVLRIEPTRHQLFLAPDALRQAAVMNVLQPYVRVPEVLFTESRADILGAPFYVMQRVRGKVTSDVPSWHSRGWVTELSEVQRSELHDNALRELVKLHRVDTSDQAFDFLRTEGNVNDLQHYVYWLEQMYEWCEPVRVHSTDVIEMAMRFIIDEIPDDPRSEGATLGPCDIDVAWWALFDEFLCESLGITRLSGIVPRREMYLRYCDLGGEISPAIGYFEVLAGLLFTLTNSRLAHLLVESGASTETFAASIVDRAAKLTRQAIERLS